ncbi:MAG: DUF2254 domain-containing protein [Nocardioidaceae bacterium]
MWATFFGVRQYARQSLWIVPLLGGVAGAVIAQAAVMVEDDLLLPESWSYSQATASTILSAVSGAMVALLGFVVTIGVLVVQMATGSLSPRFMRIWYRDRLQKVVLAGFVATFTFSFTLLGSVEPNSLPHLGVTLAGTAVAVDLVLLLVYLDRFVHTLRPVSVAAIMARAGVEVVLRAQHHAHAQVPPVDAPPVGTEPAARVLARRSGSLQAVKVAGILRIAAARDLVCVTPCAIGDFVTNGSVLVEVYGSPAGADERHLRGMFALGRERTLDQDPAFALRVMVDVAIRALSPAVNDPTSATQVIDHIGGLLLALGRAQQYGGPGGHVLTDAQGRVRLAFPRRSWCDYLDLAVTEIRRYGSTSVQITRRLRAMLEDVRAAVPPEQRPAVEQQLAALHRSVTVNIADPQERAFALGSDPQGLGGASLLPGGTHVG